MEQLDQNGDESCSLRLLTKENESQELTSLHVARKNSKFDPASIIVLEIDNEDVIPKRNQNQALLTRMSSSLEPNGHTTNKALNGNSFQNTLQITQIRSSSRDNSYRFQSTLKSPRQGDGYLSTF